MKIQTGRCYAVLTGDIVGSSRLPPAKRASLLRELTRASRAFQQALPEVLLSEIEVFRGDSWQVVLSQPSRSLRTGLFFRAFLKPALGGRGTDARVAIGLGTLGLLPEGRPSLGDGEAFRLSGSALDRMPRSRRMSLAWAGEVDGLSLDAVNVVLELIDVVAKGWTERQANAVCGKLLGWNQSKVARSWFRGKVSQQAIAQHLDRAGWNAIEAALELFERRVAVFDGSRGQPGRE